MADQTNPPAGWNPPPPQGAGQPGAWEPPPPPPAQPSGQAPVPPPAPVYYPPVQSAGTPPAGGAAGQPGAAQQPGAAGGPPTPPKPPSPLANFQLGALFKEPVKLKVPKHGLSFDEKHFMTLLAGSISLTKDEKRRIVDSIPKLKQSQIDELIRIFEEEKMKFAELGQEHVPQLDKLAKQHYEEWMDLETAEQQTAKKQAESSQAEELRKKLGLGGRSSSGASN